MGKATDWLSWGVVGAGAAFVLYAINTQGEGSGAPSDDGTKFVFGNQGLMVVKSVGNGMYLIPEAADAFNAMAYAALADGINLVAGSGFRSVAAQTKLYAQYVARGFGPPTVALPGTSNHGKGIAVDIAVTPTQSVHYGSREFAWLTKNAATFGFDWSEGKSVNEPWHWNWLG